jgi:hypothetical protein
MHNNSYLYTHTHTIHFIKSPNKNVSLKSYLHNRLDTWNTWIIWKTKLKFDYLTMALGILQATNNWDKIVYRKFIHLPKQKISRWELQENMSKPYLLQQQIIEVRYSHSSSICCALVYSNVPAWSEMNPLYISFTNIVNKLGSY